MFLYAFSDSSSVSETKPENLQCDDIDATELSEMFPLFNPTPYGETSTHGYKQSDVDQLDKTRAGVQDERINQIECTDSESISN